MAYILGADRNQINMITYTDKLPPMQQLCTIYYN